MSRFCILLDNQEIKTALSPDYTQKKESNTYSIGYSSHNKFENDKVFFEDDDLIILLDGVIFNKKEIQESLKNLNWGECLKEYYFLKGDTFYNNFRGPFAGALFNKKKKEWLVFTDHIGDKPIYYTILKDSIIIGSEISEILAIIKAKKQSYKLDERGAYLLLTYGFMFESYTLFKEVKRVKPGCFLTISDFSVKEQQYHVFSNTPNPLYENIETTVKDFEFYFKQAVLRQYNKDAEYNYKHICGLSGGLDSRMTTIVAHKLGFTEQTNMTFSQNNYLDEKIAKKIAADYKHDWVFKSLNNGLFLYNIDEITKISYGNGLYSNIAHGKSCSDLINFSNFGLTHTGQLGEGSFYLENEEKKYSLKTPHWTYSTKLMHKLSDQWLTDAYKNEEIFYLYSRGFIGGNQGLLPLFIFTETFSPFYDVDFLSFYLSIPWNVRKNYKAYHKWMLTYHKDASEYIWEKTNSKIGARKFNVLNRSKTINELKLALGKRADKIFGIVRDNNMNPFDYYYATNTELRNYLNEYFKSTITLFPDSELKEDIRLLFNSDIIREKLQALSLLSAYKLFFN